MSKNVMQRKISHIKLSLFIVPFMLSFMMTLCIFISKSNSLDKYGIPVYINCFLITVLWLISFIFHERKVLKNESDYYFSTDSLLSICILIVLFLFGIKTIWGLNYLSLHPTDAVNSGTQFIDSLYHSSIAESSNSSFPAKYLINNCTNVRYHCLSHIIIGKISLLYQIPAFITYNLIYPVIFLPLYFFSQVLATVSVKKFFHSVKTQNNGISNNSISKSAVSTDSYVAGITSLDMALIFIGNFGIFLNYINLNYAVWFASFILSESFMCANTFLFLFLALLFSNMQKRIEKDEEKKDKDKKDKEPISPLFRFVVFPISIFIIGYTKISVGYILAVALISYLIFMHYNKISYWVNGILCGFVFLITYYLTTEKNISGINSISISEFSFFAFAKKYIIGKFGYLGHIFLLSLPLIGITVILFLIIHNYVQKKSHTAAYTNIRSYLSLYFILIITAIAAFLPGMVLYIKGSSLAYFSYTVIIPFTFFLCAFYSCLDINKQKRLVQILSRILPVIILVWSIFISEERLIFNPCNAPNCDGKYDLYNEFMTIRSETQNNPDEYIIYLDDDAYINSIVEEKKAIPYYYCALTRIPVINASYYQDFVSYSYGNIPCTEYGFGFTPYEKLSYDEACSEALKLNKTTIIHVTPNGYSYDYLR